MHLDEARLRELGLNAQPFSSAAMPPDPAMEARLDLLVQLLQFSRDIVVITGPAGAGLSRVLTELEHRPGTGLRPLRLDGRHRLTADDICQACLRAYGLPAGPVISGPTLVAWVTDGLDGLARTGERPALLVDHAGELDDATLKTLVGLQNHDGREYLGPALLLAGEPELEERLEHLTRRPPGMPRLQALHLEPWTVDQVADYVARELARVGGIGGPAGALLDPEFIHRQTGGLPDKVPGACLQALARPHPATGSAGPWQPLARRPSRRTTGLLAAALLFTVLIVALMLRPDEASLPMEPDTALTQDPPVLIGTPPDSAGSSAAGEDAGRAGWRPDSIPDWRIREDAPMTERDDEPPAPVREPDGEEPATPVIEPADPQSLAGEPSPGEPEPTTADAALPPEQDPAPDADTPGGDGDWLATRPAEHYTIQLIAAHNRQALEGFVSERTQGVSTRLLRTRRDGRNWYVVITGDYPDRDRARAALEELPADLRAEGAWIRTLGSLQDSRH